MIKGELECGGNEFNFRGTLKAHLDFIIAQTHSQMQRYVVGQSRNCRQVHDKAFDFSITYQS